MICAACHAIKFTKIPGVTRWIEVFACDNCGTLRVRVRDGKTKIQKDKGSDA